MREGLSRTQKVADAIEVVLVLFDGLDAQTVPGQHRLVTRSVAWWREELEISVAASQEKSQPEKNMHPSELYEGCNSEKDCADDERSPTKLLQRS